MRMGGGQVHSLFPMSSFKGLEEQKVLAECWDASGGTEFLSPCFSGLAVLEVFFLLFVQDL